MKSYLQELTALGISGTLGKQGRELRLACVFHEDAGPDTFSINLDTGVWHCFVRCGGGTWMDLIERLRTRVEYAPQHFQQARAPVLRSLLERGFTRAILATWGAEWDGERQAMRFPVHLPQRIWNLWRAPEGVQPRYRYEVGFPRASALYGLWLLPARLERLVLVEGPLDAIWAQAAGCPAVAILGSDLSEQQAALISEHTRRAVLCFDADTAGASATARAAPLLRRLGVWVLEAHLPPRKKDIQEVPLEHVKGIIAGASLRANGKGVVRPRYQRWA